MKRLLKTIRYDQDFKFYKKFNLNHANLKLRENQNSNSSTSKVNEDIKKSILNQKSKSKTKAYFKA